MSREEEKELSGNCYFKPYNCLNILRATKCKRCHVEMYQLKSKISYILYVWVLCGSCCFFFHIYFEKQNVEVVFLCQYFCRFLVFNWILIFPYLFLLFQPRLEILTDLDLGRTMSLTVVLVFVLHQAVQIHLVIMVNYLVLTYDF